MTASVQLAVFRARVDRQVCWSIISLITIDVMDVLILAQLSVKHLLHHVTVLAHIASNSVGMVRHSEQDVSEVVDVSSLATFHAVGVVAADVPTHNTTPSIGELAAATRARLRFHRDVLVVAFHKALAVLVAKIWTPRRPFSAPAGAQRRFKSVTSQEVRLLVTEQVLGRDRLATATSAGGHAVTIAWLGRTDNVDGEGIGLMMAPRRGDAAVQTLNIGERCDANAEAQPERSGRP